MQIEQHNVGVNRYTQKCSFLKERNTAPRFSKWGLRGSRCWQGKLPLGGRLQQGGRVAGWQASRVACMVGTAASTAEAKRCLRQPVSQQGVHNTEAHNTRSSQNGELTTWEVDILLSTTAEDLKRGIVQQYRVREVCALSSCSQWVESKRLSHMEPNTHSACSLQASDRSVWNCYWCLLHRYLITRIICIIILVTRLTW